MPLYDDLHRVHVFRQPCYSSIVCGFKWLQKTCCCTGDWITALQVVNEFPFFFGRGTTVLVFLWNGHGHAFHVKWFIHMLQGASGFLFFFGRAMLMLKVLTARIPTIFVFWYLSCYGGLIILFLCYFQCSRQNITSGMHSMQIWAPWTCCSAVRRYMSVSSNVFHNTYVSLCFSVASFYL